jgi:hypothetical protein
MDDGIGAPSGPELSTAALDELHDNLGYARDRVMGGRYLEKLKVQAFAVADLYRAAWVQAVSALDHWVHRELYDRASGYAANSSIPRPAGFESLAVPMKLVRQMQGEPKTIAEAFRNEMKQQYGWRSFQQPDKIKQALLIVSDDFNWPAVHKSLVQPSGADATVPATHKDVQFRVSEIAKRRNRIAHEADRDQERPGERSPITDRGALEVIDFLESLCEAILKVLGEPPGGWIQASPLDEPSLPWRRADVDSAIRELATPALAAAARSLLDHADQHGATFKGGTGKSPSAGLYYSVEGKPRSVWSIYLSKERPVVSLNFGPLTTASPALARRVLEIARSDPALNAALAYGDDDIMNRYPSIPLETLASAPGALEVLLQALDLAVSH